MAIFQRYHERATSEFVIESDREVMSVTWNRYRCEPIFDGLTKWLRSKGIQGNKPLHTLWTTGNIVMNYPTTPPLSLLVIVNLNAECPSG
jgi:hypothetical protein